MFLCPFDNIQAGDMIKDKRYSAAMQVVGWDKNSCDVQNGIKLKVIEPFLLNGKVMNQCAGSDFDIDKQRNNMEEKRNVAISLEEAREWYKSGNNVLKTIALKAYSENELAGYEYMKSQILTVAAQHSIPMSESYKWSTLHKMAIIAEYYNTVQYAGIVYFRNAQDAKETAKLLFDELSLLFQVCVYIRLIRLE